MFHELRKKTISNKAVVTTKVFHTPWNRKRFIKKLFAAAVPEDDDAINLYYGKQQYNTPINFY